MYKVDTFRACWKYSRTELDICSISQGTRHSNPRSFVPEELWDYSHSGPYPAVSRNKKYFEIELRAEA